MAASRRDVTLVSPLALEVKALDPARYLATLLASASSRQALFALYAFECEIARVRRVTSEPMAALVRLQWWREALEGIAARRVVAHPVIKALADAIAKGAFDHLALLQVIEAREQEIELPWLNDGADLNRRLEATHGTIVKAALRLLGTGQPDLERAADHLGRALGFLEFARFLRAQPAKAIAPLVTTSPLPASDPRQGQHDRVREAAMHGMAALQAARRACRRPPRASLPALLPGTLAGRELRRIWRTPLKEVLPGALGAGAAPSLIAHWLLGRF